MGTQPFTRGGGMGRRTAAEHGSSLQRMGDKPGNGWRQRVLGNVKEERLATGLGWFSIGLGLAEVAAPQRMARLIGVRERTALIRGLGFREIASGIGILANRRPAGWVWSRVAGDAMDLSLLGSALKTRERGRGRTAAATAAVAGVTVLDLLCSQQLTLSPETGYSTVHVTKGITVNRSPEEVYRFWRDLQNLPRFMKHLESVQATEGTRSHWKAKGPAGMTFEWDAEITSDEPNSAIAWRSVEGSGVQNSGSVRFERAPGGRGTVVRVDLQYSPPGGAAGAQFSKLLGREPGQQIEEELRRFKQILETGEIVNSDASIHRGMHPAQPPARQHQVEAKRRTA
ncbi:MAG TPA: SRPBCC family protein [Bryobacteraceae bacterium]|nr:SRPBCC family protein [Bryobacteraceae bacterium]